MNVLRNIKRLSAIVLLAALAVCSPQSQGSDPQDFADILSLATFWQLNSGNCVHSIRQSGVLARLSCSRTPRGQCSLERRVDLSGNTVVTRDTQDRYRAEWALLVQDYPRCGQASVAAAALPAFRASTQAEIDAKNPGFFSVIADCDALNSQNGPPLINRLEHDFIQSPRGVLAAQALQLSRNFSGPGENVAAGCLNDLIRFEWERNILNSLADGEVATEKTCLYGSGAVVLLCNDLEKAAAHAFDLVPPL